MKSLLFSLITVTLCINQTHAAERIVSTAGYASEIVAALDKAHYLIGVDTTSMRPNEIMESKPKIGYRRQLSAEGILSLKPDLVILAQDAGPDAVVQQIKASGVNLLHLEDKQSLEGIREAIAKIAEVIQAQENAKSLIDKIVADEQKLIGLRTRHSTDKKALILIDTGNQGVFTLGKKTAGEHFLALLNLTNQFNGEGNKPLSAEALVASDANVILLATRGEAKEAVTITPLVQTHPHYTKLANTQAGKKGCLFAINILDALGFGPYTANYAHQILTVIQPCLK